MKTNTRGSAPIKKKVGNHIGGRPKPGDGGLSRHYYAYAILFDQRERPVSGSWHGRSWADIPAEFFPEGSGESIIQLLNDWISTGNSKFALLTFQNENLRNGNLATNIALMPLTTLEHYKFLSRHPVSTLKNVIEFGTSGDAN